MREYKREEIRRSEVSRAKARIMKKQIGMPEILRCIWVVAIVVVILTCILVCAYDIDIRELPKTAVVIWCTLASYVLTWMVK